MHKQAALSFIHLVKSLGVAVLEIAELKGEKAGQVCAQTLKVFKTLRVWPPLQPAPEIVD